MADETELRIVNSMLSLLGEGTQASLETQHPSVLAMRSIIDTEDFNMQSRGWWYNRESSVVLTKDADGRVTVPSDAMSFKLAASVLNRLSAPERSRYVRRGVFVYDTIAHTNVININITCDLVMRQPLSDLPPQAVTYLSALCREEANLGDDGDPNKQRDLKEKRVDAWGKLYSEELNTLSVNALQSPQAAALQYAGGNTGLNPNIIGG